MRIILLIFVPGLLALQARDFILEEVQRNINHSVNPCDNFYRHACPNEARGLTTYAYDTFRDIVSQQETKAPLNKSNIEKLYKYLQGNGPRVKLPNEKILRIMEGLRKVAYFLQYKDDNNLQTTKDLSRLKKVVAKMMETARKNFKQSRWNANVDNQYSRELIAQLDDHLVLFGLERQKNIYQNFELVLQLLDGIYEQHFIMYDKVPISEDNILERSEEFCDIIENIFTNIADLIAEFIDPALLESMENFYDFNAVSYFSNNVVWLGETVLHPAAHTVTPAVFGSFGWIYGHELMHVFLTEEKLPEQKILADNGVCVMNHARKMCAVFGEDTCLSGNATYSEDAADYEGAKLAYEAFLDEIGDTLNETVAHDMNITNQQMFFYSMAKVWCLPPKPHEMSEPLVPDAHSTSPVRVNGAISLINGFHEAFNCKAGDRMMDVIENSKKCNHFGKEVFF